MKDFDFFFQSSIGPLTQQVESFNIEESSQLTIWFFVQDHMLYNVFLVEWVLEQLVLQLGEEEKEDVGHIDKIHFQESKTVWKNNV